MDGDPHIPSSSVCIACGGREHRVRQRIRTYTIEQCRVCGLARTCGPETAFDFSEFYDRDYFVGAEGVKGYNDYFALAGALARTNRSRVRTLRRLAPRASTLLDVGCGPGFFVEQARAGGLSACGLEVSPFAARYGRDELGLPIAQGMLDADGLARCGRRFDVITLWDVIEHLPDPTGAVELLAERLAPDGVLALSTGDVRSLAARVSGRRWHLYNLPEHLWFFTEDALRRILERCGLRVERVRREVCWYTARYLLDRLMYTLGRGPLKFAQQPICSRITLPFSLFDIVTIHARKPDAPAHRPAGVAGRKAAVPAAFALAPLSKSLRGTGGV